jgi:hypothetical protein
MSHRSHIAAVLVAALLVAAPAAAQSPYVGARLGASRATLGGPAAGNLDSPRRGFVAGVLGGWRFGERLALQSEITWIQKGAGGTLQGFEGPIAADLELNYVQIPLLLRLTLPTPLGIRPVVLAGGAVSIETHCSTFIEESELALTSACAAPDSRERPSSTDWSVLFGAGLEYDAGPVLLGVEARYDLGLVEVSDVSGLENRAGVLTAGVILPLGR